MEALNEEESKRLENLIRPWWEKTQSLIEQGKLDKKHKDAQAKWALWAKDFPGRNRQILKRRYDKIVDEWTKQRQKVVRTPRSIVLISPELS